MNAVRACLSPTSTGLYELNWENLQKRACHATFELTDIVDREIYLFFIRLQTCSLLFRVLALVDGCLSFYLAGSLGYDLGVVIEFLYILSDLS